MGYSELTEKQELSASEKNDLNKPSTKILPTSREAKNLVQPQIIGQESHQNRNKEIKKVKHTQNQEENSSKIITSLKRNPLIVETKACTPPRNPSVLLKSQNKRKLGQ